MEPIQPLKSARFPRRDAASAATHCWATNRGGNDLHRKLQTALTIALGRRLEGGIHRCARYRVTSDDSTGQGSNTQPNKCANTSIRQNCRQYLAQYASYLITQEPDNHSNTVTDDQSAKRVAQRNRYPPPPQSCLLSTPKDKPEARSDHCCKGRSCCELRGLDTQAPPENLSHHPDALR